MSDFVALTGNFTQFLGSTGTIAVVLLPVLAWYDWAKDVYGSYAKESNTLAGKFWRALLLTLVAFLVLLFLRWIFNRNNGVVTRPL